MKKSSPDEPEQLAKPEHMLCSQQSPDSGGAQLGTQLHHRSFLNPPTPSHVFFTCILPSKMLSAKLFSFCALVASAAAQTYTYEFNPASAGGVKGAIQVQYAGADSSKATVSADLDFSGVDLAAITKADGNCTAEVTEYKWHIHVKWGSNKTSDSYGQCSKALAGNHYDPLKACGPNSEFAEAPECLPKIKSYACNPGNYTKNPE
ncbi:TPA: hypothetical protein N0F65_008465, partial [Lagenidium giganteum]